MTVLSKFVEFNHKNILYDVITVYTSQCVRVWPDGGYRRLPCSHSLEVS